MSCEALNNCFPKGMSIGIKQPYMKLTYDGIRILRNDNAKNFVLDSGKKDKKDLLDFNKLKNKGMQLYANGEYFEAIKLLKNRNKNRRGDSNP